MEKKSKKPTWTNQEELKNPSFTGNLTHYEKATFYCSVQGGGVGKSLLMYLMALKKHHKENCLFVDMDASTFTSRRQLSFVDEDKLDTVSLLNERAAIQRDNLFCLSG